MKKIALIGALIAPLMFTGCLDSLIDDGGNQEQDKVSSSQNIAVYLNIPQGAKCSDYVNAMSQQPSVSNVVLVYEGGESRSCSDYGRVNSDAYDSTCYEYDYREHGYSSSTTNTTCVLAADFAAGSYAPGLIEANR